MEAIRRGDQDPWMMEIADFWLKEKQLIPKLFKVLAPRYLEYDESFTQMFLIPAPQPTSLSNYPLMRDTKMVVLELKGNVYPPLPLKSPPNPHSIHNVLLRAAQKDLTMPKE
ncbi:MRPL17 [Cordylochernes scorpioides]|uniref:MRPL17 n=1 Tax=Cordylochernes scorpioides TaxID=51811 RepID=A0ABY6JXD8_9ARAC|nr:MRPL17 [Cordylochernes scorpioides]